MTSRERLTELRYNIEKNSFILSIFEARIAVVLHAEEMGYPDTETAQILKISPQYVAMIRALKDKYSEETAPNGLRAGAIEDLAQIIYDKVYVEDHKYAGHFSRFDTDLLNEWFELKQRQEELFDSIIDRQQAQAVFQDSYFQKFGTRLSIREIQEKPEQKQQETEPEEEEDDIDSLDEFQVRLVRERLLCQMFKEGAIDEKTTLKYMDALDLGHGAFLKIVEIYTSETGQETKNEPETKEKDFDYFGYHKQETEAKLLCKMYREGVIDEKTTLEYIDEPSLTHEDFLRVVDTFAEKE